MTTAICFTKKGSGNCFARISKVIAFISILSYTHTMTLAQKAITGIVTGMGNAPLFGATIHDERMHSTTSTDAKGYFTITAKTGDLLVISFVGYVNKEVYGKRI